MIELLLFLIWITVFACGVTLVNVVQKILDKLEDVSPPVYHSELDD